MSEEAKKDSTYPDAEAHPLSSLVDIGAGAVVSRTLHKGRTGTLTLFGFDKGEELSEHAAPFDAWVQIVEGTILLTIGGEEVEAKAGELVLMPANVPHAVHAKTPSKMLLTMFRG